MHLYRCRKVKRVVGASVVLDVFYVPSIHMCIGAGRKMRRECIDGFQDFCSTGRLLQGRSVAAIDLDRVTDAEFGVTRAGFS